MKFFGINLIEHVKNTEKCKMLLREIKSTYVKWICMLCSWVEDSIFLAGQFSPSCSLVLIQCQSIHQETFFKLQTDKQKLTGKWKGTRVPKIN